MTTYWRDKKAIIWTFIIGIVWGVAGLVFFYQEGSSVLAIFWSILAVPWILKGISDLKVPYLELTETELIVRRSVVTPKKIFKLSNIEGLTRVERKEVEILHNESGNRSRVVILVNELNGQEISRFAKDLNQKLKAR